MAVTLANSPRAVEVSVYAVRAFAQFREFLASNKYLARQLKALEQRIRKKLGCHERAWKEAGPPPDESDGLLDTKTIWCNVGRSHKKVFAHQSNTRQMANLL